MSNTSYPTALYSTISLKAFLAGALLLAILLLPARAGAQITGVSPLCSGDSVTLSATPVGGTWSSSATTTATIGSATGILHALFPGTATITYTTGSGTFTTTVTVNGLPNAWTVTGGGGYCAGGAGLHVGLSSSVSGINYQLYLGGVATGLPLAGTGSPLDYGTQAAGGAYTVRAINPATGCTSSMIGSVSVTVNPLPVIASGPSALCAGTTLALTATPAGGAWSSSSPAVATVGSSTGLVSGIITGITTITYTDTATSCTSSKVVTVSAAPCPLTALAICAGNTSTLSNCSPGGAWSVSAPSVASVGSLSGTVTGLLAGTGTISYTLGSGCTVTTGISVNAAPAGITGPSATCVGSTITLSDATPSGAWSSSAGAVASVSSIGVVTGAGAGTATISYTLGGCVATALVSVTTAPSAIYGPNTVCAGVPVTELDSSTGGAWSMSPAATGSIDPATGIVTGIAAGVATVSYTHSGCLVTRPITVNATAPVTGPSGLCIGSTASFTDVTPSGLWTSSNPSVATIIPLTGTLTGVAAGSALISYSAAGCIATLPVTVSAAPGPVTGASFLCVGNCSLFSGALPGGVWSSSSPAIATAGSVTGNICGLSAGATHITYSLGPGCYATTIVTVAASPAAITGPTDVCVGFTAALSNSTPGGAWSSSDTSLATIGSTSGTISGISAGTVIISYSLGTGCLVIDPVVVDPFTAIYGVSSLCAGQTAVFTDSTLGGGWASSDTSVATVSTGGLVTGVAAGSVIISYNLPGGCTATHALTVNVLPSPISGVHTVCGGQSVVYHDGTPSGTWSSSNAAVASVSSLGIVTGGAGGTAIIYYTAPGGCASSSTITVNAAPTTITGSSTLCVGGAIGLASSPTGGSWTSSSSSVATVTSSTGLVAGITAGNTVITYSLSTGCYVTSGVTVNAAPGAIAGSHIVCAGATTSLSDIAAGGAWSSGSTSVAAIDPLSGLASGLSAGTAAITYSTGAGCNAFFSLTVNPAPAPISGSTLVCPGATITLFDVTTGGAWTCSDPAIATIGASSGILTGISNGIANITYTSPAGCAVAGAVFVNAPPAPIAGPGATCIGLTMLLTDATAGGTWASSSTGIATVNDTGLVTGIFLGSATITYTAPTGCIATTTVAIHLFPGTITGGTTVCSGSSIALSDGVTGGTWSSSNPSVAAAGSSSGTISGLSAGTALITYSMGAGCAVTRSLTVNPLPTSISGTDSLCGGTSISLSDATPGGSWSVSGPAATISASTGLLTGISAGTVTVSYTVLCTVTHRVIVNPAPSVIGGSLNTCPGGSTLLTDPVAGGLWSLSNPVTASINPLTGNVSGLASGADTVAYILTDGCSVSGIIHVYPAPLPFSVTGGGSYCAGGAGVHVGLSGSQTGVNYLLYLGSSAAGSYPGTGSPVDFGLQTLAGTYTVVGVSPLTGCTEPMADSAVVAITPVTVPSVTIIYSPADTVCSGTAVTFAGTPVHGGAAPGWQWLVNGVSVGTSPSYAYIPVDGDIVTVKMASSIVCAAPDTVASSVRMVVNPSGLPAVTITASPGDTICRGSIVTLAAHTTFGGAAPVLTWVKNGSVVSSTPLYSFIPSDSDRVYCVLQSNYACRLATVDTALGLVLIVDTPVVPVVTISAIPGNLLHIHDTLVLTATVTNGGPAPSYQWMLDGIPVPGATSSFLVIDTFSGRQTDSFTCKVTGDNSCSLTTQASTLVTVAPVNVPAVALGIEELRISPNPNKGIFRITGVIQHIVGGIQGGTMRLLITDLSGKRLFEEEITCNGGKIDSVVSTGDRLPRGLYHLSLLADAYTANNLLIIE